MTMEEISAGEGERLEFKRALSRDDTKWLKTVAAFANGHGGRIVFGVDSDLSVVGMEEDLFSTKDSIADAIANRIKPMPPVDISVSTLKGKPVIVLDVQQGGSCPYYIKSQGLEAGVYVRYDATTRLADEMIIRELTIDGSGTSFDQIVCRGLEVSSREVERLCRRLTTVAKHNARTDEQRRSIKALTARQLVKWGVLAERDGKLLPTWSYVLLSGHTRMSPQVKCGVFKGSDRTFFVDRREFVDMPIQDQVEKATQYVLEKINMGARFNGVYREDVYEIPPDAIRELIVNAVVHRSYVDGEASPITIALHPDRLEITTPGGLPRGMTLAKMMTGYSKCRNRALAAAFAYMNLIENWGSGMCRCAEEIAAAGLRELDVVDWGNAIRVNVYRSQAAVGKGVGNVGNRVGNVGDRVEEVVPCSAQQTLRESVLSALKEDGGISAARLAKRLNVACRTIERTLKGLQEAGRLRRIGGTRGHWEVEK